MTARHRNASVISRPPSGAGGARAGGHDGWRLPVLGALVVTAVVVCYLNSLSVPFVLDDDVSILENQSIRHLADLHAILAPTSVFVAGRPLVNLSFALNYAFGGTAVGGYHAFNLVCHLAAALTLWGVMTRTLVRERFAERSGLKSEWVGWVVALAWAVHPLLTASVTYVSQRAEVMMGLCYLLTLYCVIRSATGRSATAWNSAAIVCCAAGMAVKETMVTAPVICLIYDRVFLAGSFRAAWQQRWKLYVGLAATWVLLAALMTGSGFVGRVVGGTGMHAPREAYAITQVRAVANYLQLVVWPHPQIFDYGTDLAALARLSLAGSLATLVLGLALGIFAAQRWPATGFLLVWFFGLLAPTSSIVPILGQPIAENRAYLPSIAVVAAVVLAVLAVRGRRGLIGLGLAVVALGLLTAQRNHDYRSKLALWSDTVTKRPENHRAQGWLGLELIDVPGRFAEGIGHLELARSMDPGDVDTQQNIGVGYLRDSAHWQDAIGCFELVLRSTPDNAKAHGLLGTALFCVQARPVDAISHLEEAVRLLPDRADFHKVLGAALLGNPARWDEAVAQLQRAGELAPADAQVHMNLGNAYVDHAGGLARAITEYQAAVTLDPGAFGAWFNLGNALVKAQRPADAATCFENTLKLAPEFAPAKAKLADLRNAPAAPGPK